MFLKVSTLRHWFDFSVHRWLFCIANECFPQDVPYWFLARGSSWEHAAEAAVWWSVQRLTLISSERTNWSQSLVIIRHYDQASLFLSHLSNAFCSRSFVVLSSTTLQTRAVLPKFFVEKSGFLLARQANKVYSTSLFVAGQSKSLLLNKYAKASKLWLLGILYFFISLLIWKINSYLPWRKYSPQPQRPIDHFILQFHC